MILNLCTFSWDTRHNVGFGVKQDHTNYLSEFFRDFREIIKTFRQATSTTHQSIQPIYEINHEVHFSTSIVD